MTTYTSGYAWTTRPRVSPTFDTEAEAVAWLEDEGSSLAPGLRLELAGEPLRAGDRGRWSVRATR